jgi:peptidoglycan/xylan/chitin deacetylase (PgdA/CDA1 family)
MAARGRIVAVLAGASMTILATLGKQAFRVAALRRAAFAGGALRHHGLVLVYHRIRADKQPLPGLIPSVPEPLFRRQIETVLDAGEIVPLEALLRPNSGRQRPRFALTFDDDSTTHHELVLPILRELGVTATFFLSGRSLHELGPLWFENLDGLIAASGVRASARWLGIDTDDLDRLAMACEQSLELQERIQTLPEGGVRHLCSQQIRDLSDAGMAIGFHTLHHTLFALLSDSAVAEAVTRGRSELEVAAGRAIRLFAYPHGKADPRAAQRLLEAGYVAACSGRPFPVRPGDDPYHIGRWEPGPIGLERFAAGLAVRLNGWRSRP